MDESKEITMYKYYRNGIEYFTPNEQIAMQRSDTGEFFIVKLTSK